MRLTDGISGRGDGIAQAKTIAHASITMLAGWVMPLAVFALPLEEINRPDSQNAVLQAVQITSESSAAPSEIIITCYFIFSGKPSQHRCDIRPKEKQIVFSFYDAEIGSSPIASQAVPPIIGFSIEKKRLNSAPRGRDQTVVWSDVAIVTFLMSAMPRISINEEEGVIFFSFQWTTDREKQQKYAVIERKSRVMPLSLAALSGVGIGALVYMLTAPAPPAKKGAIPYDDLPQHVLP